MQTHGTTKISMFLKAFSFKHFGEGRNEKEEKGKWAMLQIDFVYCVMLLTFLTYEKSDPVFFSEQFTVFKKLKEMDWIISLFLGINLKVVSSSLLLILQLCSNSF